MHSIAIIAHTTARNPTIHPQTLSFFFWKSASFCFFLRLDVILAEINSPASLRETERHEHGEHPLTETYLFGVPVPPVQVSQFLPFPPLIQSQISRRWSLPGAIGRCHEGSLTAAILMYSHCTNEPEEEDHETNHRASHTHDEDCGGIAVEARHGTPGV